MYPTNEFPHDARRRLLRLPEVSSLVGLRRSAIYNQIKRGLFPAPVHIGARAVAWVSDQIDAWIDSRTCSVGCTTIGEGCHD